MLEKLVVVKGQCSNSPDHEQCFHDAGFVDVKVVKKVLDVGNWRPDGIHTLMEDGN
jgi:hypothetical protein